MLKKEIHLEKAGTLHKFLTSFEKENVTHLTLSGLLNDKDFYELDDMCTCWGDIDKYDNHTIKDDEPPYLINLDMGNCKMEGEAIIPYFTHYSKLEKVVLPNNAIQIGYGYDPVFEDSERLKSVIFPESLKKITYSSFHNCDLREIKLPENLEVIERNAFGYNTNLKSVILPKNLLELDGSAFYGCGIEKYELNDDNRHLCVIDGVVFSKDKTKLIAYPSGCKKEHYIIPDGTKIICSAAFSDSKIKFVTIPDTLEIIEDCAFEYSKLEQINIPNSVTVLGKWIFIDCISLKQVKLPDRVSVLKDNTFSGCISLKELEIPC